MIMRVAYGETDKGAVRICPGDILWPKVPGPIIPALESQRNLWPCESFIVNVGVGKRCYIFGNPYI